MEQYKLWYVENRLLLIRKLNYYACSFVGLLFLRIVQSLTAISQVIYCATVLHRAHLNAHMCQTCTSLFYVRWRKSLLIPDYRVSSALGTVDIGDYWWCVAMKQDKVYRLLT